MNTIVPIPLTPEWPEVAPSLLHGERQSPPELPLNDVVDSRWADWIHAAAEAKGAPADYVFAALLSVTGSLLGNNRWVMPWSGWAEPPIVWTMAIGLPSSGKSPAADAILAPLKRLEHRLRQESKAAHDDWHEKADIAKLAEAGWKGAVRTALKEGNTPPGRPTTAETGAEPFAPRLAVVDATIEKLAVIVAKQPRGVLLARDELSGWLLSMARYSSGGSDRPFWLEAYGGRGYSVERMSREAVYIDRLSISVTGGIQPERLNSLLVKTDDDGLLARFLPVWPSRAPIKRPESVSDTGFLERAISKFLTLLPIPREDGSHDPAFIPFSDNAKDLLDAFRLTARGWEDQSEGLLLSFTGKLPGVAVRLSLVLAYLDWAAGDALEPAKIGVEHFGRAAHLVETYFLPMARQAYADASLSKQDRAARRLLALIREQSWGRISTREVLRMERTGIATASDLNPALEALEQGDAIRAITMPAQPQGGRPARLYLVNPAILEGEK